VTIQTDIALIQKQEAKLQFKSFSEEDAWNLGLQMREAALARGLPVVIDIRIGSKPLFYVALAGTTADNPDWVRRKTNTVMRFECSSYLVGLKYKAKEQAFDASRGIEPLNYASAGGGFPIRIRDTGVIGCVTVSGLPQRDDHSFVVENIATFLDISLSGLVLPEAES
jgi:uncharacterized protein (UPF0303 family)